jgi:glutamine---fructose-6-phosphate transaminase (isomerizing)
MKNYDFSLTKEIWEIPNIVRNLDINLISNYKQFLGNKVIIAWEGSSRIFPAKNSIYNSYKYWYGQNIITEWCTQSLEYVLDDYEVFVISNSWKTKEWVRLIRHLKSKNHKNIIWVVSQKNVPILDEAHNWYVLTSWSEQATAATKSVIEQALFMDIILRSYNNLALPDLNLLWDLIEQIINLNIPEDIINTLANSQLIYWWGRNNGVAEELRLKTNEITRLKSDYLEWTYAVHGIEEVMDSNETIIFINPFPEEIEKYQETLSKWVNIPIISISQSESIFPTIKIPKYEWFDSYLELVAWLVLLTHVGIKKWINIDTPQRARKVGNQFFW